MTHSPGNEPFEPAIPEDIRKTAYVLATDILHTLAATDADIIQAASLIDGSIAKAILAERQRHQWQPIQTAPKDGAEFLAWFGRQNVMMIARFDWVHSVWLTKGEPFVGFMNNATHWMPLPRPPKGGEA